MSLGPVHCTTNALQTLFQAHFCHVYLNEMDEVEKGRKKKD
jgi:hypothetical protein